MSTQDRAIRGEQDAQSEGHEGGEAVAIGGGQVEPMRLRAMQRRWIQRKANGGGGAAAASIPGGAGAPLGGGVQSRMERTLGADLSGVRVHTGGESAEAAEGMGARAFTVGSDVHFGRGEFAPGSKEGDRLLAHELTHVVQGQKSGVQRKADAAHGDSDGGGEHGDHEAGGHEVSEPGDAPEKEADAMGDHAADALHDGGNEGGGDKGGGGHGAAAGEGGKKVAPEKPKVAAAAPSVGRKIFRANKPGAAPAKAATASATTKPGPAASKDAPTKPPEEIAKEKQVAEMTASLTALGISDPQLATRVSLALQGIDKDLAKFPKNEALKAYRTFLDTKKQQVIDKCQEEVAPLLAALDAVDEKNPASAEKLETLKKSPALDKWARNSICGPYTKDKHPRLELFTKTLEKKMAANKDAIEKQKQHEKEEQEKKKAHGPDASASGDAPGSPAQPAGGSEHKAAPASSSATPPVTAAPKAAATATASTPTTAAHAKPPLAAAAPTTGQDAKPHPATGAAPAATASTATPPAPASTTTATTTAAPTAHGPAPDTHAAPSTSASTPSSTTGAATATTAHAPPAAADPAAEAKKQELALKKEVAVARVKTALAAAEDKSKIFGAALEGVNIALMLAKGYLGNHGIELPEELVSRIKDAIAGLAKGKLTQKQVDALFAMAEIQSIQTVDEIDQLFADAEVVSLGSNLRFLAKKLSQEEALKSEALALLKAKGGDGKSHAGKEAGHDGKHGDEAQEDKKPHDGKGNEEELEAHGPESGEEKDDKDKKPDGKKKTGLKSKLKHATEAAYEKGVKGPIEAEDKTEEREPVFKAAAERFGPVLDEAKTGLALIEAIRFHLKDLKAAKQAQQQAEQALEAFLADHGGKAVPNQNTPQAPIVQ